MKIEIIFFLGISFIYRTNGETKGETLYRQPNFAKAARDIMAFNRFSEYLPERFRNLDQGDQLKFENSISSKPNMSNSTCITPQCYAAGAQIKNSIDDSMDPCDDFYKYACGNYKKNDLEHMNHVLNDVQQELDKRLKRILLRPINSRDLGIMNQMKTFYKDCIKMNNTQEAKLIGKIVDEAIESCTKGRKFDLIACVELLLENGLDSLFPARIKYFEENSFVINFLAGGFYYFKKTSEHRNEIHREMVKLMEIFDGGSNLDNVMNEILDEEIALFTTAVNKLDIYNFNDTNLTELESQYPKFPWRRFISIHAKKTNFPQDKIDSARIIILPAFFLDYFMNATNIWPEELQLNMLRYNTFRSVAAHLLEHNFTYILSEEYYQARERKCFQLVKSEFPVLLSSLYVRNRPHLSQNKQSALEMTRIIKDQFIQELSEANYTKTTIQAVEESYSKLKIIIGYDSEAISDDFLESYYNDFDLDQYDTFLQKSKFLMNFTPSQNVSLTYMDAVEKVLSIEAFFMDLSTIFYTSLKILELTIPMLEPPFYSLDYPFAMQFGRVGFIFAHELAHSFIRSPLKNLDKTEQNMKCMIMQYNNYPVRTGKNINGTATVNENIADVAGIQVAYKAYKNFTKQPNFREYSLPGIKASPGQLFWISSATAFCRSIKDAYLNYQLSSDTHTPEEVRFNAAFSNMKGFADDFQCKLGSKMNPVQKCIGLR